MMWRNILLFILLILYLPVRLLGQKISVRANSPRVGDCIKVYPVKANVAGANGKNVMWNFCDAEIGGDALAVSYMACSEPHDCMMKIACGTRIYEKLIGDSLISVGHESNTLKVEYDKPEVLAVYPMCYGDSIGGYFYGSGKYCDRLGLRVIGAYYTRVDATGCITLPDGKTVHDVLRLHTKRSVFADMFYTDSVCASRKDFTDDEIGSCLAIDSCVSVTDEYHWYASGYRYPIFQIVEQRASGSDTLVSAYYTPTFEQESLVDRENESIRAGASPYRMDNSNTAAGNAGRTYAFNQNKDSHSINVSINSANPTDMEAMLASVGGVVYQVVSRTCVTDAVINFDYVSLPKGQYVVYINVGGEKYVEKFNF